MPTQSLTHLKEKLKKLDRLLIIPRFWALVFIVAFTVAYHYGSLATGYSIAVGWLWLALIISVFVAGLRAGLICAAWIAGYAYYVNGEDPTLLVQRIIVTFLIALLVGWCAMQ